MTNANWKKSGLSRRGLLQTAGVAAGALAATKVGSFGSGGLFGEARAQFTPDKQALLIVNLRGGYNSLFCSADSFLNQSFGVTSSNIRDLGNGLFVDNPTYGTLPASALAKMATLGVRHGLTSHEAASDQVFHVNNMSAPLALANAMGGDGAIKAVYFGNELEGMHNPVNGVSMQRINDMGSTLAALGGMTNATIPDRTIAANGLIGARAMSTRDMVASPQSLRTVDQGFPTAIDTLSKPVKQFNFAEASAAYGVNGTGVGNFRTQMLAAELMVFAGTNVIVAQNGGWDTHGDTQGGSVRTMMTNNILPGLRTFIQRMAAADGYQVTVAILGEFARSLPGSDHQANLSVTVTGPKVRVGTTGRTNNDVQLPAGTPNVPGLWSYFAEAVKAESNPFGPNPHNLIL